MNTTRYTWIKLYTEIIDDPKMGNLDDRLWRRTIELFLLAGRNGSGGTLPPIGDLAWSLRTTPAEIDETLKNLQTHRIVNRQENGTWNVTHFAVRQAALSAAERQRKHRETHHNLSQVSKKS